jgi:F-type H+-transporting ATPase subunit epsilon
VKKGRCVVVSPEEQRREGEVEAGILTVDRDQVTLLTSAISWNE